MSGYNVYRSTAAGFAPSAINRVAQVTGTSFADFGLASGTYHSQVTAQDAAGNIGTPLQRGKRRGNRAQHHRPRRFR